MIDRLVAIVGQQIALADIGDVTRIAVFREQVIKGLILARAQILRDLIVPFLGIGEDGIDIEHDPTEIEHPVPHDVADREIGVDDRRDGGFAVEGGNMRLETVHPLNLVPIARRTSWTLAGGGGLS